MTLLADDPVTQLAFSVYENKGVFALLLGSGLSRAAQIPTGWEVTLDLIRRIALTQGVEEQSDWAAWYRQQTGQEPNYSTLLEELALSPEERRSILHSYIEPTEEDRQEGRKLPTKAHLAIADLVRAGFIRVIITTNFDRLMENALRERGVEPIIVASTDALAGAAPIVHSACYILKLHGDYKDARILNTDAELSAYPPEYDRLLERIFDEHGLIVAGWSGEWDHALRAALLRAPNRRYPVYWAAKGSLGDGAQELIDHRAARIVPVNDADSFFSGLQQRVETLAKSHRQNPMGIDLLVSSTKRFLSKPEYRIQLDELFADETDRLVTKMDGPDFNSQGTWDPQNFRNRIATYEAATEPLAKMAGVLGRWGDDDELPLMLDVIRSLNADAKKVRGGLSIWIGIRSYPAVLVFSAYGLGLVRSERWEIFSALCAALVADENRRSTRFVDSLFLWAWEGAHDERIWKNLDGMDKHKTPLSDHLCDVFSKWGQSFLGLTPDHELLFERFETMQSLAYIGAMPESELKENLNQQPQEPVAMPVGRIGWDSSRRKQIVEELNSQATRKALVEGGLAPTQTFIELFVENLNRVAGRMSWY